jgi:uncharacterized membrane protein YhfC
MNLLTWFAREVANDLIWLKILLVALLPIAAIGMVAWAWWWKKPKDSYEAAWLAIGLCAVAFVLK